MCIVCSLDEIGTPFRVLLDNDTLTEGLLQFLDRDARVPVSLSVLCLSDYELSVIMSRAMSLPLGANRLRNTSVHIAGKISEIQRFDLNFALSHLSTDTIFM